MIDSFPGGCPCNLKIENIAHGMNTLKAKYWLLKIGKKLEQMITEFKKHIARFNECELENASKVFGVISESIIKSASML